MKKNLPIIIALCLMCMSYTTSKLFKDPNAPIGNTGAPKALVGGSVKYCNSCHGDFGLNTGGGNVVATGLPTGTYTAGQVYNFTIKVTHGAADRTNWGFAIKAINNVNYDVTGTFSTTNPNASLKGAGSTIELSSAAAPTTTAVSNYTFVNLKWTAPAAPSANEASIQFYIVGVAGDSDGSEAADYVYSTTVNATLSTLPITLKSFDVKSVNDNVVNVSWRTSQELNTAQFDIEKSYTGNDWLKVGAVNSKGNSSTPQSYSFADEKPALYNSNIYYRLKIIDQDGTFKYSAVETIKLKNAGIVIDNLSAQPLAGNQNGVFKIYSNATKMIAITVTDMNGRMLYNSSKIVNSGANTIEIPGAEMAKTKGMVVIKFQSENFVKTLKQLIN